MTNDDHDMTHDTRDAPETALPDDARFAPPPDPQPETSEAVALKAEELAAELALAEAAANIDLPVTDGMDIEAALAAVSTLSDMLAEQEAAEQARIAQIEAEAQAAAERQARMEHPERFFPVPPLATLQRGQMASVVPALLLIGVGAWLTFTLTTTQTPPDAGVTASIALGGLGLTLLARWLASGRWARGALFGGLALLLGAGILIVLLQPASPGLERGWPLLLCGVGVAAALSGLLAFPHDRRLLLPGLALLVAGIAGAGVLMGALGGEIVSLAASLWPVAAVIVALILLLPIVFRQRR